MTDRPFSNICWFFGWGEGFESTQIQYLGSLKGLNLERAILRHEDYPTRMELWNSLPKKIQYQTFQRALQYLERHGIIAIDEEGKIFYTGVNNKKLQELLESSVPAK